MDPDRPEPSAAARRFAVLLGFLHSGSASGLALIGAACVALIWSNSALAPGYFRLISLPLGLRAGTAGFVLPLGRWVNDGLMALFFLLVGLEIRREIADGHLSTLRRLAAPGLAALGGMVVPALIYLALNRGHPATLRGWAVPVATDIAFALAALSVLGRRVPMGLKVFLTALAILDDLGAIVVIAFFYTHALDLPALLAAGVVGAAIFALNRAGIRALSPYVLAGIVLWACVFRSGIHPTLAGVALAFLVPGKSAHTGGAPNPADRLESGLGGWVTWGVLPLFGLANAGLRFSGIVPADLIAPATLGTALGLILGKQIGVFGATMLAVRLRLAHMPAGLTRMHLYGGALLCGIGFTMSLFIGDLSFGEEPIFAEVKLAVFAASLISAALGLVVLGFATRPAAGLPEPAASRPRLRARDHP